MSKLRHKCREKLNTGAHSHYDTLGEDQLEIWSRDLTLI